MTDIDIDAVDQAFEQAAFRYLEAHDLIAPGHFVSRWMVIGVSRDPENPDRCGYFVGYSGGAMPEYEAHGLLVMAGQRIDDQSCYVDDDGDEL